MPFTFLAHQAPVLPLKLVCPRRASGTALVIGSIVPDFDYFFEDPPLHPAFGHTPVGQFAFCLPLTIALVWLFRRVIARPLARALPELGPFRLRDYAALARERPRRVLSLEVAASALAGSLSHLALDAFTHKDGWVVERIAALRAPVLTAFGSPMPLFFLIQIVGTIALALFSIAMLASIGRRRLVLAGAESEPDAEPPRRALVLGVPIAAAIAGIAWGLARLDTSEVVMLLHGLAAAFFRGVLLGSIALTIACAITTGDAGRVMASRRARGVLALVLAPLVGANVAAFLHARAMTHFDAGGERTASPQRLSTMQKLATLVSGVSIPRPRNIATPASFKLPFETITFASKDGVKLEAWRIPRERARGRVLLFHGYASAKSSQLDLARAIGELGFETWLVDFRGSGGSEGDVTSLGWHEANDVAAAFERASDGAPPILYGTSMGSVAILRAIRVHGIAPRAIVLECPFGRMLDTVAARCELMDVPSILSARLLVFWGGVELGFDGFAHEPVEYAASVRCPALVLHGDQDLMVSDAQTRELVDRLAGPRELVTIAGAGHHGYLGFDTRAWRAAVEPFLRRAGGE